MMLQTAPSGSMADMVWIALSLSVKEVPFGYEKYGMAFVIVTVKLVSQYQ
jgi:hypothetical protein